MTKEKKPCGFKDCSYKSSNTSHLRTHKSRHEGVREIKCDYKDCTSEFFTKSDLKRHMVGVHHLKPYECDSCEDKFLSCSELKEHLLTHVFKCDFENCEAMFPNNGTLETHKNKHTKPFVCTYNNCGYRNALKCELEKHTRIHQEHKFKCDLCEYKTPVEYELKRHIFRVHTSETPFHCNFDGCEFKCNCAGNLATHKRRHHRDKEMECETCGNMYTSLLELKRHRLRHIGDKLECDFENCTYKCIDTNDMSKHKVRHGEKKIQCEVQYCEYKCFTKYDLIKHKKTHTLKGRVRKKKQENRIYTLLKDWGYTVDLETMINSKRGNCLKDTSTNYSFLDFRIVNSLKCILILEVDENQHYWYTPIKCEFTRMADVRASLVLNGYTLPIYWIRYNPNGKYKVNGKKVDIKRVEREKLLKNEIDRICSDDFFPEKEENIHYMFYDLESENDGPCIMYGGEFPEPLKECVTWK